MPGLGNDGGSSRRNRVVVLDRAAGHSDCAKALADRDEFDEATIARLRDLARERGLSKFESVVDALVGDEEAKRANY